MIQGAESDLSPPPAGTAYSKTASLSEYDLTYSAPQKTGASVYEIQITGLHYTKESGTSEAHDD